VARIVAATEIAASGLTAMIDALVPGVSERDLLAAHLERISSLGAPTPPTEGVACATPTTGPVALRRLATGAPIEAGQLVVLDAGALHLGYEGGVGRTWVCPGVDVSAAQQAVAARCRAALDAVIAEAAADPALVVATGGGAVLDEANRRALSARGFVVYLQVSVAQQLERLARDRSRPLLAGDHKQARLEALATVRGPIYAALADLAFDADGLSVATAADRLHGLLLEHWQRPEAA